MYMRGRGCCASEWDLHDLDDEEGELELGQPHLIQVRQSARDGSQLLLLRDHLRATEDGRRALSRYYRLLLRLNDLPMCSRFGVVSEGTAGVGCMKRSRAFAAVARRGGLLYGQCLCTGPPVGRARCFQRLGAPRPPSRTHAPRHGLDKCTKAGSGIEPCPLNGLAMCAKALAAISRALAHPTFSHRSATYVWLLGAPPVYLTD